LPRAQFEGRANGVSARQPLPDALLDLCASEFRVLGQPWRLRVIDLLERNGEANVQSMVDALDVGQQNLSRHLGVLHTAGLVHRRREGREVRYGLLDPGATELIDMAAERIVRRLREHGNGAATT
jgi:DNA-binding transcriptional ArsR family regulator